MLRFRMDLGVGGGNARWDGIVIMVVTAVSGLWVDHGM